MLALAISKGWKNYQLDINNAFLNRDLKVAIYMMQLLGFVNKNHPTKMCNLHKSLCGLQQSPWAWYDHLWIFLILIGVTVSISDDSLFLCITKSRQIYISIYVDIIIIRYILSIRNCKLNQSAFQRIQPQVYGKFIVFLEHGIDSD